MNNGAFGENFPYTNFHDLNMDWIIKIVKDFLEQYTHIQELIADGEQSLQDLTEDGLEQLQTKADNLENLLQQWYNTHSADIANQLASALADLNAWYTTHQNYLNQTLEINTQLFNNRAEAKAESVLESIPSDYTTLSNRVTALENSEEYTQGLSELLKTHNAGIIAPATIIPEKIILGTTGSLGDVTSSGDNIFQVYEYNVAPGEIYAGMMQCFAQMALYAIYDANDTPITIEYPMAPSGIVRYISSLIADTGVGYLHCIPVSYNSPYTDTCAPDLPLI